MFKVTKYPQGTFSWTDCSSTNAAEAKKFYVALMGWKSNDLPMGDGQFYHMFEQDGESVGGLGQMQAADEGQSMPSHWNSYVTVDDVDAMTTKAKELGATVLEEPFDVFNEGRMSLVQDPTGASFAMWQPKETIGAGIVNTPGAMTWNELMTRDTASAMKFYGELFGWTFQKVDNMDYYMVMNNGRVNGGIMALSEEWGDAPASWMVYFSVADIEDAVAKVNANGGKVINGINDAEGIGRFAIIADPCGAQCSVIQLLQPQPWDLN